MAIINENQDAKDRIINAAINLFSQKGYDGTRVNEISDAAKVTKALIYYYFKSKEEILNHLTQKVLKDATSITMDFIHDNIEKMIKTGQLKVKSDRLHFIDDNAINVFLNNLKEYKIDALDYALKHRSVLRVMMLESLKKNEHQNSFLNFFNITIPSNDNLFYKTISKVDDNFTYSDDMILFKLFFSFIPIITFAIYFDDYLKFSALSAEDLRSSFLRTLEIITNSVVVNKDILFRNKKGNEENH